MNLHATEHQEDNDHPLPDSFRRHGAIWIIDPFLCLAVPMNVLAITLARGAPFKAAVGFLAHHCLRILCASFNAATASGRVAKSMTSEFMPLPTTTRNLPPTLLMPRG